jgi:hypothetical protein
LGCGGLATALCFFSYYSLVFIFIGVRECYAFPLKNKCFKQKSNVLYSVGNSPHKKYDSLKMAAVP